MGCFKYYFHYTTCIFKDAIQVYTDLAKKVPVFKQFSVEGYYKWVGNLTSVKIFEFLKTYKIWRIPKRNGGEVNQVC